MSPTAVGTRKTAGERRSALFDPTSEVQRRASTVRFVDRGFGDVDTDRASWQR